jgi:sigma-B regulation protein RsbU (phosphoserine phosphatase)
VSGLDIAGRSIYCDETGGDYYDFIPLPEMGKNVIGIAVGDVVGHGIGAALLMTTVRAFLHSKASEPGGLSRLISKVNRLLCADTHETNSFATLFFTAVDPDERKIHWVRAGHDPALIYSPSCDAFEELRGAGIALGVDDEYVFPEYTFSDWTEGQIMVIGTDGIWETENPRSEAFGKARLKEIIRRNSHLSAREMVEAITDELAAFRQTAPQWDDATMAVVKILHTEGNGSR